VPDSGGGHLKYRANASYRTRSREDDSVTIRPGKGVSTGRSLNAGLKKESVRCLTDVQVGRGVSVKKPFG